MHSENPELPSGYSPLPVGKLANMVTFLEMRAPPEGLVPSRDAGLRLTRLGPDHLEDYRRIFSRVGEDWMWFSLLTMDDTAVMESLRNPLIEHYVLQDAADHIGLLELDFTDPAACEIVYFGLVSEAMGKGAGRFMMTEAMIKAWEKPIARLWLHTCSFDHPAALAFYQKLGFVPYKMMVEVHDDPRLTGLLPKTAAPHIPWIEPAPSPD